MRYWMLFLSLALTAAGFLAFDGPALASRETARLTFYAIFLLLVISVLSVLIRSSDDSSRRPPGPRRP